MSKYICIHGHFYQPPRENPWLEEIERQDSAYPYHDWNQRITAECYEPNTAARILDNENRIVAIINNFTKISFNFGPSLLSWMERNESNVYQSILKADSESIKNFSGHGSAIAQCYNHIIMPLANKRDKYSQINWGIRDFEYRFKRKPEGMWLPETAVDLETLDIMAEQGIKFTILAPHQAKSVRKIGNEKYEDVKDVGFDIRVSYRCILPSGRDIALFFYDGALSQNVAFGNILNNGQSFAEALSGNFSESSQGELMHISTDGETYGHHHKLGDMGLAYCLHYIESKKLARITNYGEFLEKYPPTHEVEIFENSSWSCCHGIERWKDNCGCNSGIHQNWNQSWRLPLRGAMDWLRDNLSHIYEEHASKYLNDIWQVRDNYIDVILNRSTESVHDFIKANSKRELAEKEKITILKLLEMQRHSMLMYTSCGWFFDEISGIETVQVTQYAARAMQLALEVSDIALEETYIKLLKRASSNIFEFGTGADVYEKYISPAVLALVRVGAHYAVSSLFEDYSDINNIYCYIAKNQLYDRIEIGKQKLAVGKALIHSNVTMESTEISFAVLHLGDHNLIGGVREFLDDKKFSRMHHEIKEVFKKNDVTGTMHQIEKHFETGNYSLWHLFKDEQSKILYQILHSSLEEIETSLRQINEHHYPIIQVIKQLHIPLPKILANTVSVMLNTDFLQILASEEPDFHRLKKLVEEVKEWSLEIDKVTIGFVAQKKINSLMTDFSLNPESIALLEIVESILRILNPLSLNLDLWKAQNIYFFVGQKIYKEMQVKEKSGDQNVKKWLQLFNHLGEYLKVRIV